MSTSLSVTDAMNQNMMSRYLWYDTLHYIPVELKQSPVWAAQNILFAKFNSRPLVDPNTAMKFRELDKGKLDETRYRKRFDPKTPDGDGGKAEFISSDWKPNPIFLHLNNIVDAGHEKIPLNLYCKATDEYAKLKQQKENDQILGRRQFIAFFNDMNKQLGYPPLKPTEDPFKYAKQIQQRLKTPDNKAKAQEVVTPDTLMDSIKASITDNEDMALFNEFIYKGDVEIAVELGIKHFFGENKFPRISERVVADIRNFNACAGRMYTSKTTGRPILEYADAATVNTSNFNEPDGADLTFWYREWEVTFGEWVRMFGRGLDKEQIRDVFEQNRLNNGAISNSWEFMNPSQRDNTKMSIGYMEWMSQDCEVYAEGQRNGNLRFKRKPTEWVPSKNTKKEFQDKRVEKHFNVWYKCYYIPNRRSTVGGINTTDFLWQSRYIYDFGRLQDQQRFGDDSRLSRCSLVLWKRNGMSFAEVMDSYMPHINHLWHRYQHYISQNDTLTIYAKELVDAMMDITEESNKQGKDSGTEWLRYLEQTGKGTAQLVTDEGKPVPMAQIFSKGTMKAALEVLNQIQVLYNQMTVALGISDVREGIDPKPRESLGGIQLSLNASNNATWFIEKGYMDFTLEMGKRILYYMDDVIKSKDARLDELKDIIGLANGLSLEALSDIPLHRLGLHIENVNTDIQKQKLEKLSENLVASGNLDIEVLNLILKTDNYKYAAVLMIMKFKDKQRQKAAEIQSQRDFDREMKLFDLQIKQAELKAKYAGEGEVVERGKKWDFMIDKYLAEVKKETMLAVRAVINSNKKDEKTHDVNESIRKENEVAVT